MRRIRKFKKDTQRNFVKNILKVKGDKTSMRYVYNFYQKNKFYIQTNIDPIWVDKKHGNYYEAFKSLVKDRMRYVNSKTGKFYTPAEAVKGVINSKDMNPGWTASDVYANNFLSKIKSDKDLKRAITNKMSDDKKYIYQRKGKEITRLRDNYSADKIHFEGYYFIGSSKAIVYSYDDDVYIIEYQSPKKGTGATFDVIGKEEFERNLETNYIVKDR